ncbi:hypothetical protein WN51_05019 [Melipona quadrifasciata]|uniref:Uncharacterized protein n=1 Tax=Melipona quadrifasciata TaxID=166423 RepID=A0A0N0BD08_9HYME|nr:hypothetical protein WN51_05019 [Melipona quadrifasciata]
MHGEAEIRGSRITLTTKIYVFQDTFTEKALEVPKHANKGQLSYFVWPSARSIYWKRRTRIIESGIGGKSADRALMFVNISQIQDCSLTRAIALTEFSLKIYQPLQEDSRMLRMKLKAFLQHVASGKKFSSQK